MPTPPGYNVQINNQSWPVVEGSFQADDSVNSVSTVMFKIRDDAGTSHFTKGMPVSISSVQNGLSFTGFVSAAVEDRVSPNVLIFTNIGARDNHTLAEKRTYDGPELTNQYAIVALCQLLNVLSQEGITAQYAIRRDTTYADFSVQAVQAQDTFTRANQAGLGTASDGEAYTLSGAAATSAITSNEGVISATTGADTHAQLGSQTLTDQQLQCRIAVNNSTDKCAIEARFSPASGSTSYKLQWSGGNISLMKSNAGVNTTIASVGWIMTPGTFYQFKLAVVGTALYGKIWQDGLAEPTAWTLTALDGSIASGGFALLANSNTGSGVQFDHFTIQLAGAMASNNVGDGDLELAPSGSPVTILENTTANFSTGTLVSVTAAGNTLSPTPTTTVKLVATCSVPGSTNAYTYVKIWQGSHLIGSNERFLYDVFVLANSPTGQMAVDVIFSDGTTFRDTASSGDGQNIMPHPQNDITPLGIGQWYRRDFNWGNYAGKTVQAILVACEGDNIGTYTGYFKNIKNTTSVFNYTLNTTQQMQNNGYSSAIVSVVNTYELTVNGDVAPRRISTGYSVDAPKILQSSMVTWSSVEPVGTKMLVKISYDGAIYQTCTKNAPLPGFVVGGDVSGGSLFISEAFVYDPSAASSSNPLSPENKIVLNALQITLIPSYVSVKNDVFYEVQSNANWAAGTFTNMTNRGGSQAFLNGFIRNWDDGNFNNQTRWSTVSTNQTSDRQRFSLTVGSGTDVRSQLVDAGNIADGTIEVDILVDNAAGRNGVVYRTTNWNNVDLTFAYGVEVTLTTIKLIHGSNSGSTGSVTTLSTQTLAITSGNWHRLKVVFVGTSHKVYLDDVLYINITDSFTTAAGGVALRCENATGASYTAFFDNFGVLSSGATLNGTWLSPVQNLATAGTYGNSVITWRDISSDPGNTDTVLVETQVDGSTWQAATNGGAIPNLTPGQSLAGINLRIRMTLTTTTASTMPAIDSLQVWVSSQINATGTRVGPVLSLASVGRLGGSVVAWNANLASGCTLGVDARVDAGAWVDVTASPGGAVPGLTAQSTPYLDSFDTDTSANYTNTFMNGGAAGTATFDTANSRLILTGGTNQVEQYNALSFSDGYVECDMDYAASAGPALRMVDASNLYYLKIRDDQAAPAQTIQLFKNVAGTKTQIGSNASISFLRGTVHRIHFEISGTNIIVNFDGIQVISTTDASIAGPGKAGLYQNVQGQFYSIRVLAFGQDVTSHTIQTRLRLASTNPIATPQVLDHALVAFGTNLSRGALIPQTTMFHKYIDVAIGDLANASETWYYFDKNLVPYFLPQNAMPAPWVASDGGIPVNGSAAQGDFLDGNITVEDASPMYRNREIVDNVLAPTTINETRIGDGVSTSWTFGNEWAGAPTITITNKGVVTVASVGVKNVDTGKQFYYAVGDKTITEDGSGPLYDLTFSINFQGPAQFRTYSQYDDLTEQAAMRALQPGTSGIFTWTVDGTGLTKAQGDTLAQADVDQYKVRGRLLKAETRRYGLAPGQLLSVFLPSHKLWDTPMLIRSVQTKLTTEYGIQQGWYTIEAITGPEIGDWTKLYKRPRQKPQL